MMCCTRGLINTSKAAVIRQLNIAFGRDLEVTDVDMIANLLQAKRKMFGEDEGRHKRTRPRPARCQRNQISRVPPPTRGLGDGVPGLRFLMPMTIEVEADFYEPNAPVFRAPPAVPFDEVQYFYRYPLSWQRMCLGMLHLAFKTVVLRILEDSDGNVHRATATPGTSSGLPANQANRVC